MPDTYFEATCCGATTSHGYLSAASQERTGLPLTAYPVSPTPAHRKLAGQEKTTPQDCNSTEVVDTESEGGRLTTDRDGDLPVSPTPSPGEVHVTSTAGPSPPNGPILPVQSRNSSRSLHLQKRRRNRKNGQMSRRKKKFTSPTRHMSTVILMLFHAHSPPLPSQLLY